MAFIKAYLYDTIEQAQVDIDLINEGEGIPVSDTSTTRTYCEAQENNGQIYICHDDVIELYLGAPEDLEIIEIEE